MKKLPLVSVIIGTKNSAKYLEKCLKSVRGQTYKNIEIILVDNFSADSTLRIAKKFTKKIYQVGPERSVQYNFAVAHAKGKYIYRIDSDFYLEPDVVRECVEKCEKDHIDAIAVHITSDPTLSFWAKVKKMERDCYIDDNLIVAVRFLKRDVFNKIGGFDERMYAGEDYDLHNRFVKKGFKWGRVVSKEIHLGEVKSLSELARVSYYYGRNSIYYVNRHNKKAWQQMTPIREAYIKHWKDIVSHPVLLVGLIIMNLTKYFFGGLGYFSAKMGN